MKIIKPSVVVEDFNAETMIRKIEMAGRTCYKSEAKITTNSANNFIKRIIKNGHLSVLEHEKITARIICDRGVSHELVRHRIASYSQESTRYVDYLEGIEVIQPCYWVADTPKMKRWVGSMRFIEATYIHLRKEGATPQEARAVLPNSLVTEIVVTRNLRSWRNFLLLRCAPAAHPQMREVADMILDKFYKSIPVVFEDIYEDIYNKS